MCATKVGINTRQIANYLTLLILRYHSTHITPSLCAYYAITLRAESSLSV